MYCQLFLMHLSRHTKYTYFLGNGGRFEWELDGQEQLEPVRQVVPSYSAAEE